MSYEATLEQRFPNLSDDALSRLDAILSQLAIDPTEPYVRALETSAGVVTVGLPASVLRSLFAQHLIRRSITPTDSICVVGYTFKHGTERHVDFVTKRDITPDELRTLDFIALRTAVAERFSHVYSWEEIKEVVASAQSSSPSPASPSTSPPQTPGEVTLTGLPDATSTTKDGRLVLRRLRDTSSGRILASVVTLPRNLDPAIKDAFGGDVLPAVTVTGKMEKKGFKDQRGYDRTYLELAATHIKLA